jgi:hypothetical protein
MKRTNMLSMLAAAIAIVLAMLGGASELKAQGPCPCVFTISVKCGMAANCYPLSVMTNWTNAAATSTLSQTDFAPCGSFQYAMPTPCPPQWTINWASLDGGTTTVTPGNQTAFTLPCGDVVCLEVRIGPSGCVHLIIGDCP